MGKLCTGHIGKLLLGIKHLQYATEGDDRILSARKLVGSMHMTDLKEDQRQFWDDLRRKLLQPEVSKYQEVEC